MAESCKVGGTRHEHCEDIDHKGQTLVVCHDCEKTLGLKCEVYSRVAGYLRPTNSWNKGKASEFSDRKTYVGVGA